MSKKLKNGTAAALWIASGCCCCCDCHLLLKSCAGLIFAFRLPLFILFLLYRKQVTVVLWIRSLEIVS
jgi:hypothetical protein